MPKLDFAQALLWLLLSVAGAVPSPAQTPPARRNELPQYFGGVGVGNGVAVEAGRLSPRAVLLGRVRYKWWVPSSIRQQTKLFDGFNTRSRQAEYALLAGYPLPLGPGVLTAAAGAALVAGRQLGEYRYTRAGFFTDSYVFSYTAYRALGVPVQLSWTQVTGRSLGRRDPLFLGVSAQANFNPVQPEYCLLLTFNWHSRAPAAASQP